MFDGASFLKAVKDKGFKFNAKSSDFIDATFDIGVNVDQEILDQFCQYGSELLFLRVRNSGDPVLEPVYILSVGDFAFFVRDEAPTTLLYRISSDDLESHIFDRMNDQGEIEFDST